jgi:hypothetical protein
VTPERTRWVRVDYKPHVLARKTYVETGPIEDGKEQEALESLERIILKEHPRAKILSGSDYSNTPR